MKVLGLGNALVDVLTVLMTDDYIEKAGLIKGGMLLIDEEKYHRLTALLEPFESILSTGGSAANTVAGLARLGVESGFIGKVGRDNYGRFFYNDMSRNGVEAILMEGDLPSGCVNALISPDGERSMGTYLGSAVLLEGDDLTEEMFAPYDLLYIEGYLVQNYHLIRKAASLAKACGLRVAIDMASYNVVAEHRPFFMELIGEYVDIVFANEEESEAYTGCEAEESVRMIAQQCEIAVVKCGSRGAYVCSDGQLVFVPARQSDCIDTTGAGDLYSAGFIYGLAQGYSLEHAAGIGSIVAGNVVEIVGTKMSDERWHQIKLKLELLRNK